MARLETNTMSLEYKSEQIAQHSLVPTFTDTNKDHPSLTRAH